MSGNYVNTMLLSRDDFVSKICNCGIRSTSDGEG